MPLTASFFWIFGSETSLIEKTSISKKETIKMTHMIKFPPSRKENLPLENFHPDFLGAGFVDVLESRLDIEFCLKYFNPTVSLS